MTKTKAKPGHFGRRTLLQGLLGGTGLAAIATGLSPAFLRAPLAFAGVSDTESPQYLLLAASDRGDPMNANCPGSYAHEGIDHPDDPIFAPTSLTLGGQTTTAAAVWSTLPQWVLDRSAFIHHATRSAVHSEMPKILRLMGATTSKEQLPALIAAALAGLLETIMDRPVNLGQYVQLMAEGVALPRFRPTAIKQLLTAQNGPLADLRSIRDAHVDEIHAILKEGGTTEQREYLDARALSRDNARQLADDATSIFDMVEDDSAMGEVLAALALFRLRVTPVVTVSLPFGGDNHSDIDFLEETEQHEDGLEALVAFMTALESIGMQDQVTVASLNVFGRNLKADPSGGRDHWSQHAVSMLIGKHVNPGVVGGLMPTNDDYSATGIDSASGAAVPGGGDVPVEDSLIATGKTIWAATGGSPEPIEDKVPDSKVIDAALV